MNSLLDSLVSWWSMDEDPALGFIADKLGRNELSAVACTRTNGRVGKACQFTAVNGSRLYPTFNYPLTAVSSNALLSSGRSFTFAGWVKFDAIPGATIQNILSKWSGSAGEYFLRIDPLGPYLAWNIGNGVISDEVDALDLGSPPLLMWHFFVVWYDSLAGTMGIRVDNHDTQTTGAVTANAMTALPFSMGDDLSGALDEVAFWWRVLTRTEQANLWNNGNGIAYEDLLDKECKAIVCCDPDDLGLTPVLPTDAFGNTGPTNPNCPDGYVWGGKACVRVQTPQICSTGWFWDGTRCVEGTDVVCAPGYFLADGVCTICPKPAAPALTPGTNSITLSFNVALGLDYNIFRSTDGVNFILLASATGGVGTESYVDTTVAGRTYFYMLSVNLNSECGFTDGMVSSAISL